MWPADANLPHLQIITMGSARAVEKFAEAKRGKVSPPASFSPAPMHGTLHPFKLLLALL